MSNDLKGIVKIILKMILAIVPVVLVFVLLINVFPMRFFDKEYAYYKENKEYASSHTDYTRILIMGDSLGKTDYLPELLSEDSYNYALGGASIAEEYYYLKEYLENNEAPEYIIYSTAPLRFFSFDTLWTRSVYFHRLEKNDLEEIITVSTEFNELNSVDTDKINKIDSYYLYSPTIYGATIMSGLLNNNRQKTNEEKYAYVISSKGQTYFGEEEENNEVGTIAAYTEFKPLKTLDEYFNRFIQLCEDHNIKILYLLTPLNEATYDALNENFLNEYNEYLNDIQNKYSNIIYDNELRRYDGIYFGDSSHLNSIGVERYNNELVLKYSYIFRGNK